MMGVRVRKDVSSVVFSKSGTNAQHRDPVTANRTCNIREDGVGAPNRRYGDS
jgi:hypothetical protein